MKRQNKNSHGVITVLISLMLVGILSLGTMVIEAGRVQGAKTQLADANLSAGTSMIASYNEDLQERYGLLAIDTETFNEGRYKEYLEFNSDFGAGHTGNNISTLYTIKAVEMDGFYNLTYPSILKRQLLSKAKYNVIPQEYSLNYYNMDYFLADFQAKATYVSEELKTVATDRGTVGTLNDVPAEMQSALATFYETFNKLKKCDETMNVTLTASDVALLPSTTGTVEHTVPTEDLDSIADTVNDASTVLGAAGSLLNSNSGSDYSEIDVTLDTSFVSTASSKLADLQQLPSKAVEITKDCRSMVQGFNAAINMLSGDKEGTLLLNSYIANYFSNKNWMAGGYIGPAKGAAISGMDNATFSAACTEYVFSGDARELVNQQNAYDYIIATRMVGNLYAALTTSPSFNRNNACSVAAHIAWAYYESFTDAELMFTYNAVVPFGKYNMILPINNAAGANAAFGSKDFLAGMSALGILSDNKFTVGGNDQTNYRDALAFALWFVPNSQKMLRTSDLIQLEMRYKEQHVENTTATFLMSEQNTFCRVKCKATLNNVLPMLSLDGSDLGGGTKIQNIKYVGY